MDWPVIIFFKEKSTFSSRISMFEVVRCFFDYGGYNVGLPFSFCAVPSQLLSWAISRGRATVASSSSLWSTLRHRYLPLDLVIPKLSRHVLYTPSLDVFPWWPMAEQGHGLRAAWTKRKRYIQGGVWSTGPNYFCFCILQIFTNLNFWPKENITILAW